MLQTSTYVTKPALEEMVKQLTDKVAKLEELCRFGGFTDTQIRFVLESADIPSAVRACGVL